MVPYAIARPLLEDVPAKTRAITEHARKRVENFEALDTPEFQLMYDFNEQAKRESRGTEAVLNAVVLAFDDRYQERGKSSPATRKALTHLWNVQTEDGSWDWLSPQFGLEPWESGQARYMGAALGLIAAGVAPGDRTEHIKERRTRAYLRKNFPDQNIHNQVWALWATAVSGDGLTKKQRASLVESLLTKQGADGGWSLSALGEFAHSAATSSDGYATGLVVYTLQRSGETRGVKKGRAWLGGNQSASGAWSATSVNKKRDPKTHIGMFMSDAATAFAVLALHAPGKMHP